MGWAARLFREVLVLGLAVSGTAASSADLLQGLSGEAGGYGGAPPGYPAPVPGELRYFPRGDGQDSAPRRILPPPSRFVSCTPRRVAVPTNAPDDPSYVGSGYGLSKPSYYGFTPPLGVDDPFGRSLLPYCPDGALAGSGPPPRRARVVPRP